MFNLTNHVFGNTFKVICKTKECSDINKTSHWIQLQASFTDRVVIGKDMVIIVKSFAPCGPRDPLIVTRLNFDAVRPVAEHVSSGVDEPGAVQCDDVSAKSADEPGIDPVVTDDEVTAEGRQEETKENVKDGIVFPLKGENRVCQKVRTINPLPFDPHLRVFPCQKPADMAEKESPL